MKTFELSPRQLEAVWHTAHGLKAREIAEKMDCSEQTIKNFLYFARLKLHASTNAHLVFLVYGKSEETKA
jgi:DNA-binding CsgD family transcriptional regulator